MSTGHPKGSSQTSEKGLMFGMWTVILHTSARRNCNKSLNGNASSLKELKMMGKEMRTFGVRHAFCTGAVTNPTLAPPLHHGLKDAKHASTEK